MQETDVRRSSALTNPSPHGANLDSVKIPEILAALANPQHEGPSATEIVQEQHVAHEHPAQSPTSSAERPPQRLLAKSSSILPKKSLSNSNGNMDSTVAEQGRSRIQTRELSAPKKSSVENVVPRENLTLLQLGEEYARFLVLYTSAILDSGAGKVATSTETATKPKLECRTFKPQTMDNIRVRRMCEVNMPVTHLDGWL